MISTLVFSGLIWVAFQATSAPVPVRWCFTPAAPIAPAGPGARGEMALLREACAADYRAQCRLVRPGGGRALACLADHRESLSPGCQEALMSLRGGR